jgi:hypothetical protein
MTSARSTLPGTRRVLLTDGDINLVIFDFKKDTAAGRKRDTNFSGIHHIGFQLENLEGIAERNSTRRDGGQARLRSSSRPWPSPGWASARPKDQRGHGHVSIDILTRMSLLEPRLPRAPAAVPVA